MLLKLTKPSEEVLQCHKVLSPLGEGRIRGWWWSWMLSGHYWALSPDGQWFYAYKGVPNAAH